MHRQNKLRRKLMPNKKPSPRKRDENGKFVPAKAVVSKLGVNDNPAPTEPKVVETKNGRTLTYN
mgnify:CR=1 FL=1